MTGRFAVLLALAALPVFAGDLTRRYERTLERVLHGETPRYSPDFLLADLLDESPRRFSLFTGDLSGRYLGAVAVSGAPGLEAARALAPRVFVLQREDGGFGSPLSASGGLQEDMAKLWGHGRLLVGLLEYYAESQDPEALETAERLADFLLGHAQRYNSAKMRRVFLDDAMAAGYSCWTQATEGLALLARVSGEAQYRDAAVTIAAGIERRPDQHSHGWLTSLRGRILLAEDGVDDLGAIEREWEALTSSENLLWTGGPPEYFAPGIGRDEGCSSADWLRINLSLWGLTRNERYLAAAEDALFNAFLGNQFPSGDFGHIPLSDDGFSYGARQGWWCCTLHGARAFPAAFAAAFRTEDSALHYDLPVDGRGESAGLVVEADAELEMQGRVRLTVVEAPDQPVALHIRKPSRTAEVHSPYGTSRDALLTIERIWTRGETFDLEYRFDTEVADVDGAKVVKRGPWTLAVSEGADPAYFNEGAQTHRIAWETLAEGDRPSRVRARFDGRGLGEETSPVTFRPLSERWESGEHAQHWTAKFERRVSATESRTLEKLYEGRKPAAIGFALGALCAGLILWRWRLRASAR